MPVAKVGILTPLIDNSDDSSIGQEKKTTFHVSLSSGLQQISSQDYVEYTGNEAQIGENTYFGGGMFVKLVTRTRTKKRART
jgi:hypothetical protein